MKWPFKKILFLAFAVIILNGLLFNFIDVLASTQNINVQAVLPPISHGGGCTGCDCPGACNAPPIITAVSSSVSYTSATVSWLASDSDGTIASANFIYGLSSTNYNQTGSVVGNYSVNLVNLATNTLYFYKISVTDNSNAITNYSGSFQTNSAVVIPPDTTGPIISNIIVTPSLSGAVITFDTDKNSTSFLNYGLTTDLGGTAQEGSDATTTHSINLIGLDSGKKYYYKITATSEAGYSTETAIFNFVTLSDVTAPPQISDFQIQTTTNSFILTWKNPSLTFNPDFAGVKILRKIGSVATGPNDNLGTVVYDSNGETVTDSAVTAGVVYYYTAFTYDNVPNYSGGAFVSGELNVILTPEICDNGIDDDNNGLIDCFDPACVNFPACKAKPVEICNNKIDDNGDGLVDCADPTCATDISCVPTTTVKVVTPPACSDGIDNDGDGLIDYPADPGCTSPQDNDEYNPPIVTVPGFQKLTLDKVKFYSGARQIEIFSKQNTVFGLAGSNLSLSVRKSDLASTPVSFILHVGETDKHQFVLDSIGNTYYSDILFPFSGKTQAYLEVDYGAGQFDSLEIDLQAVDFGKVVDENGQKLSGATVSLYKENGELFGASTFGQINPQVTDGAATFGWMVPNGKYYLTATKDQFYDYQSGVFEVSDSIVNQSTSLIKIPPKILDNINPNDSLVVNAGKIVGNLAAQAKATGKIVSQNLQKAAQVFQQVTSDPVVKQVANQVVAPTAVGVAAVSTLAFVSWAEILPLLRFLFLQPLMMIGRGKREKWGTVYNSLSKLPIDLAMVRLINLDTKRLLQTKVTGSDGRYFFVVNAGRYRLEVRKGNLLFPSVFLKDSQVDGKRLDIYHGEDIKVTETGAVITANIPLDPIGEKMETPKRVVWNKILRRVQSSVGWIGLIVVAGSLYISPVWYMWFLLAAHLFLTFIFRRLSKPVSAKGWGIVYDETSKKPLSKVVARLFDSKFNKLVATEVTDNNGKYYFMAGDNQYYISFDHEGYESQKTAEIDLRGKAAETISQDVKLKKK